MVTFFEYQHLFLIHMPISLISFVDIKITQLGNMIANFKKNKFPPLNFLYIISPIFFF